MGKIILDAATRAKLTGTVQRCDESGAVIAYALAPAALDKLMPPDAPFTDEEIDTAFNPGGPWPTSSPT